MAVGVRGSRVADEKPSPPVASYAWVCFDGYGRVLVEVRAQTDGSAGVKSLAPPVDLRENGSVRPGPRPGSCTACRRASGHGIGTPFRECLRTEQARKQGRFGQAAGHAA